MQPQERNIMQSFHFDVGNSNEGPIGMCARLRAETRKEAVELLREALGDYAEISSAAGPVEYIHVYFNGEAIDETDIDDWEEVDSQ
jgi:hypothetical protein